MKTEKQVCPLLRSTPTKGFKCKGDDSCAWWVEGTKQCAVKLLAVATLKSSGTASYLGLIERTFKTYVVPEIVKLGGIADAIRKLTARIPPVAEQVHRDGWNTPPYIGDPPPDDPSTGDPPPGPPTPGTAGE